ncbi:sodium/pantothenate symporter [Photobacterium sp. WH24]|uniref:sodium/pantothenate symporter n=1 Tax=Photobacterium sp. WH24 TaxID=2827237 RepID=UPI001C484A38|nr:sodium/pantothenate symporter [Photobacterium sp. WH24]MBV7263796.1 sodium/pantothenate symporter [Photobacterium sp. WH24]
MPNQLLIPLVLYLAAVFALALFTRRRAQQGSGFLNEYLLGNRSMGGFVLAMTLAATYASASSFIGGPGAAYKMGLGWVLLAMIQLPAAWLTLGVLGKKFAIEARKHNALTLNDMLYARYQHRGVVVFASLALLLAFFGTMVVQFVGGARLLQTVTGLSYSQGLMIFAATVGLYTTIGGFRAVVMTDTLQGIMMIIGTLALLAGIIHAGGSLGELVATLHQIDPALISPYGPDNFMSQPFMLSFWILVCFGVIGLPHAAVRCMSYKDSQSLHRGMVISTAMVAFLMLGMHLAGALGRAIFPDIATPDQIMPTLMMGVLPPVVAGIFLAGPMAAIMSTIDSQLIQASATLLKDLYLNYINPKAMEQPDIESRLPKLSLWVTGIFSVLVFIAATHPPDMIIWLNLLAFGGMQAVFLWPLVLGLYWQKASAAGAFASMLSGLGCYITLSLFKPDMHGVHAIVPTLLVGLISFIAASYLWPNRAHCQNAKAEFTAN